MITKIEAIELVNNSLHKMGTTQVQFVIDDSKTLEKSFGWVFFYNSKKFLETRDPMHIIAGNGPVFINKYKGEMPFGVSFKPIDEQIMEFELKSKM